MSGAVAMDAEDDGGRNEPVPAHDCPKCGASVLDFDGFGFVACPVCDFCTHPSSSGKPGGPLYCGICRKMTFDPACAKPDRGLAGGDGI